MGRIMPIASLLAVSLVTPWHVGCETSPASSEEVKTPQARPRPVTPAAPPPPLDLPAEALANGGPSGDGTYFVAWQMISSAKRVNEPVSLLVWVMQDETSGRPVAGARLDADAWQPLYRAGLEQYPTVAPRPEGGFVVTDLVFPHPGNWELYIDITVNDVTERAQFPFILD